MREQNRRRRSALPAMVAALLLLWLAWSAYVGYRFDQHSVTVDARIIGSDLGCVGAYGSGTTSLGSGNSITYAIELPTRDGTLTSEVVRPCAVVPPEFGRGRGFIWVQYDEDNPSRIRVVNDRRSNIRPLLVATLCIGYLAVALILSLGRRTSDDRTSGEGARSELSRETQREHDPDGWHL